MTRFGMPRTARRSVPATMMSSLHYPLMESLLAAILDDDVATVQKLLKTDPGLTTRRVEQAKLYEESIFHWLYVGDIALHLAAAGYRTEIARLLVSAGADPNGS